MQDHENRYWRTNIGLRLTPEVGEWFARQCKNENRTFANYIETLILKEREHKAPTHANKD